MGASGSKRAPGELSGATKMFSMKAVVPNVVISKQILENRERVQRQLMEQGQEQAERLG